MKPDQQLTQRIAHQSQRPGLLRMGHNQTQRPLDLGLGLGRLYSGLARILRALIEGFKRRR